jgi:hypothetical protein
MNGSGECSAAGSGPAEGAEEVKGHPTVLSSQEEMRDIVRCSCVSLVYGSVLDDRLYGSRLIESALS